MKNTLLAGVLLFSVAAFPIQQKESQKSTTLAINVSNRNSQLFEISKLKDARYLQNKIVSDRSSETTDHLSLRMAAIKSRFSNFVTHVGNVARSSGILDGYRRTLRTVKGQRSQPPTISNLQTYKISGGQIPVVAFSLKDSTDVDGSIDRYEITFGDGSSQVIPATDVQDSTVYHIYQNVGTYSAIVKIIDQTGDSTIYNRNISVSNNQPPKANLIVSKNTGADLLNVGFELQATDTDGTINPNSYTWNFGDGTVQSGNFPITYRIYNSVGSYLVNFSVLDSNDNLLSGSTRIYVGQSPPAGGYSPTAIISSNTLAGVAPLEISFDGTNSFDADGNVISYEWNFGGQGPKNTSRLAKPIHKFNEPGTYYVNLIITDNGGQKSSIVKTVSVLPAAAPSPSSISALFTGEQRTFRFDTSFASIRKPYADGYTIWNFGDGTPEVASAFPNHQYAANGTYTVSLKIYDLLGGFELVQKQILVQEDSTGPQAFFNSDRFNAEVGATINFTTANPQTVLPTTTAVWDFGDGTKLEGFHKDLLNVNHAYSTPGFFTITLRTTDDYGRSSIATQITAIQAANYPVTAIIKASAGSGKIPFPVKYDGRSSYSNAGNIKSYEWTIYDSTGLTSGQESTINKTFTTAGDVYLNLLVEDMAGNVGVGYESFVAIDESQVPPGNKPPIAKIDISFPNSNDPNYFRLTAQNSSDPDNDRLARFDWTIDGVHNTNTSTTIYERIQAIGKHTVSVKVTDQWGKFGIASKDFYVSNTTLPNPTITTNPSQINNNVPVTFQIANTIIPGGTLKAIRWEFGDGSTICCGDTVVHTFSQNGQYSVKATLIDEDNREYSFFKNVDVGQGGTQLTNTFLYGPKHPIVNWPTYFANEMIYYNGYETTDHFWSFGDGSVGSGQKTNHIYSNLGTYNVVHRFKDYQGNLYYSTQNVTIYNQANALTAIITATDNKNIRFAEGNSVLQINSFPETVSFDLQNSITDNLITEASWDFGDGNIGFGLNPKWIYQKPGTYTVQVTAKDEYNSVNTSSITIHVKDRNCFFEDGMDGCLIPINSTGGNLPLSENEWTFTHNKGLLSFDSQNLDPDWITITDLASNKTVNLGDITTISGNSFSISKSGLISKNLDLKTTYKLEVQNTLDSGAVNFYGGWPRLNFGIGSVVVTTNDNNTNLILKNSEGKYLNYKQVNNAGTVSFENLPSGKYDLTAEKYEDVRNYIFEVYSGEMNNIEVNFSSKIVPIRNKSSTKIVTNIESLIGPKKRLGADFILNSMCGRESFNVASTVTQVFDSPIAGVEVDTVTAYPDGPESPIQLDYLKKDLRVFCNLPNNGLINYYSVLKWRLQDFRDCGYPETSSYIIEHVRLMAEFEKMFKPVGVKIKFTDGVTGKVKSQNFSMSLSEALAKKGFRMETISQDIGVFAGNFNGVNQIEKLVVPKNFQKLKASALITTPIQDHGFNVRCGIRGFFQSNVPRAIATYGVNSNISRDVEGYDASTNGVDALENRLFPVNDDSPTDCNGPIAGPSCRASELFKFKLIGKFTKAGFDKEKFTHVKISYQYGNQTVAPFQIPLTDVRETDDHEYIVASFEDDIRRLNNSLIYDSTAEKIKMTYYPFGADLPPAVANIPKVEEFTPTFNARKLSGADLICKGGWYSNKISAFTTSRMIEAMKSAERNPSIKFLCNDFSMPWGGIFNLDLDPPVGTNVWSHSTHDKGDIVDIRYFNDPVIYANDYDVTFAEKRKNDITTYYKFLDDMKAVSLLVPTLPPQVPNRKDRIFNFCMQNPTLVPCFPNMEISDLTLSAITKLCSINENSGVPIDGCEELPIVEPPATPPEPGEYLRAMKRYSKWAETNMQNLALLKESFRFLIDRGTDGPAVVGSPQGADRSWQKRVLENGQWPNGDFVFRVDANNKLIDSGLPCAYVSCSYDSIKHAPFHLTHIHLIRK